MPQAQRDDQARQGRSHHRRGLKRRCVPRHRVRVDPGWDERGQEARSRRPAQHQERAVEQEQAVHDRQVVWDGAVAHYGKADRGRRGQNAGDRHDPPAIEIVRQRPCRQRQHQQRDRLDAAQPAEVQCVVREVEDLPAQRGGGHLVADHADHPGGDKDAQIAVAQRGIGIMRLRGAFAFEDFLGGGCGCRTVGIRRLVGNCFSVRPLNFITHSRPILGRPHRGGDFEQGWQGSASGNGGASAVCEVSCAGGNPVWAIRGSHSAARGRVWAVRRRVAAVGGRSR